MQKFLDKMQKSRKLSGKANKNRQEFGFFQIRAYRREENCVWWSWSASIKKSPTSITDEWKRSKPNIPNWKSQQGSLVKQEWNSHFKRKALKGAKKSESFEWETERLNIIAERPDHKSARTSDLIGKWKDSTLKSKKRAEWTDL